MEDVQIHLPRVVSLSSVEDATEELTAGGLSVTVDHQPPAAPFLPQFIPVIIDFFRHAGEVELGIVATHATWHLIRKPFRKLASLGHKMLLAIHGDDATPPMIYVIPPGTTREHDEAMERLPADFAEATRIRQERTWRRWDPDGRVWEFTDVRELSR